MLDKIRDGAQSVIAKVILVLVILSFAFAGVSSYLGRTSQSAVATVNGEDISQTELEQAFQNEKNRLKQQLGDMFDTLSGNDAYLANVKQNVLQRLIAQRLLDQAAKNLGLRVSDEQIIASIRNEPAFQVDGQFNNDRYLALLQQLGFKPTSFRETMRADMTRSQLINALIGSEFVLKGEASELAKLQAQTRDIQLLKVDSDPFLSQVKVTDDELKKFYDANPDQFQRPEMVSLEYVELSAKSLADKQQVSDADAQAYYDQHKDEYKTVEKRLAAHILITGNDAAAKTKAEDIHKQLVNGADFAKLAKQDSQDTLSAEKGGELGWFEAGVMAPEFDKTLFSLNKGAYSDVVHTAYGYHIIKVLDIQPSAVASFAEVKSKIVDKLKMDKAVNEFYGLQQKLSDTSYEVPDTLADAAKVIGATVQSTELFSRESAPEPFQQPAILKAAFSSDVLSGMNSNMLEVGDNDVMVVRLKKHEAAGLMAYEEVKADIEGRLKQQKANDLAKAKAEELVAKLKQGDSSIALEAHSAVTRTAQGIDPAIVAKAFEMAKAKDGLSIDSVALAKGYAVVVLDKINNIETAPADQLAAVKQRLNSQYSEADYSAVIDMLKAKAEITYHTN
ncbi:SurA N-terminal domain-containing protein [Shewanella sp. A32]|uniref:SurA N-terminal domain-containing protein n=1 Tax=Shewanella sp. A32 TaxID=3031327 RepID=UPI0023BA1E83|nr:SurA N-terminal domain-containing protein [Shewanella sp. A32]MDF0533553.1 SurA N-terminal domain-containing protein [Shewanella sp. A32]